MARGKESAYVCVNRCGKKSVRVCVSERESFARLDAAARISVRVKVAVAEGPGHVGEYGGGEESEHAAEGVGAQVEREERTPRAAEGSAVPRAREQRDDEGRKVGGASLLELRSGREPSHLLERHEEGGLHGIEWRVRNGTSGACDKSGKESGCDNSGKESGCDKWERTGVCDKWERIGL